MRIKKFIKIALLFFLYPLSVVGRLLSVSGRPVVLMYHSIGSSGWEFSVTPEMFDKQLAYLQKNGFKFLTAEELYELLVNKHPWPQRSVLATFDDGYRDFMTEAVPVLNKYKVPAAVFVHTNRSPERLRNNLPLLNWMELKVLAEDFEIGSHSHSHPDLKTLSPEELDGELEKTEQVFVQELGYKPDILSYPGGRFSMNIAENLRKREYKLAFTINPGSVRKTSKPLALPRVGLSLDTSFAEFKARVNGAGDWYEYLADLFRRKNKKKLKI